LQFALEKLALLADERDMIVMMHEIEYRSRGKSQVKSTLIVKGKTLRTAMAKQLASPGNCPA
jgi:hypothetical protein